MLLSYADEEQLKFGDVSEMNARERITSLVTVLLLWVFVVALCVKYGGVVKKLRVHVIRGQVTPMEVDAEGALVEEEIRPR